jgi:hypothetical protein
MGTAVGTVQKISVKTENKGKVFKSPLYGMQVEGTWYNCGFDKPAANEGDVVSFDYTEDKYGKQVTKGSIKPATAAAKAVVVQSNDARQLSIVYQSQHRDAIEAVNFAIQSGMVSLPTKKADQYSVYLELVKDLTIQWTQDALTPVLDPVTEPEQEAEQADPEWS